MRDAFDGIGKVFWRLVALSVAVLMFVQIGITLFLLPGAVLTLFASLSVIDLVIERPGAMTALMHSFGMVMSRFGTILLIYLVFLIAVGLFVAAVVYLVFLFSGPDTPWWRNTVLLCIGLMTLAPPVVMTFTSMLVLVYRDVHKQREEAHILATRLA